MRRTAMVVAALLTLLAGCDDGGTTGAKGDPAPQPEGDPAAQAKGNRTAEAQGDPGSRPWTLTVRDSNGERTLDLPLEDSVRIKPPGSASGQCHVSTWKDGAKHAVRCDVGSTIVAYSLTCEADQREARKQHLRFGVSGRGGGTMTLVLRCGHL